MLREQNGITDGLVRVSVGIEDISDIMYGMQNGCPENFGYKYVDNVEKRGDGDGYHDHMIYERKSDGKCFYFYSYDGRMNECDELEETKKIVVETWDFEKHFD